MAELAGCPELGVLALLYYRAGGRLKLTPTPTPVDGDDDCVGEDEEDEDCDGDSSYSPSSTDAKTHVDVVDAASSSLPSPSAAVDRMLGGWDNGNPSVVEPTMMGCGCGMDQCGISPCHLPFSSCHNPILGEILHSLATLDERLCRQEEREGGGGATRGRATASSSLSLSAADVLAKLSSKQQYDARAAARRKKKGNKKKQPSAFEHGGGSDGGGGGANDNNNNNNNDDDDNNAQTLFGPRELRGSSLLLPQHGNDDDDPSSLFANLRFWENDISDGDNNDGGGGRCVGGALSDENDGGGNSRNISDGENHRHRHRRHLRRRSRPLPPVLQLLLLKLLYASPTGGPFLRLAIEAVPHLAYAMPQISPIGRRMSVEYKSHWAYYVLIHAVVLGQRMKKHRRGSVVPYHIPVWDVAKGLDERTAVRECCREGGGVLLERQPCGDGSSSRSDDSSDDERQRSFFLQSIRRVLSACGRPSNLPCSSDENAASSGKQTVQSLPPINPQLLPATSVPRRRPLFLLGDSHVLSIAWQTIRVLPKGSRASDNGNSSSPDLLRTIVPFPATGLKAWHCRPQTSFFTHTNLRIALERLPASSSCRTILLSAGEIDCREGIGGKLLEGYYTNCDEAVRTTVREYFRSVALLAEEFHLQILLLPVAPHAYRSEKNGKSTGRALRRERMVLWNDELRIACEQQKSDDDADREGSQGGDGRTTRRVCLLDYERGLRSKDESSPVGFVLNKAYDADFTHMNSAFLPLLEEAILSCGCNLDLL